MVFACAINLEGKIQINNAHTPIKINDKYFLLTAKKINSIVIKMATQLALLMVKINEKLHINIRRTIYKRVEIFL
ncbi:MAG: hypothetical protein A2Y09_06875 [Planctomycetes bacterium GWA2_39_15]|nr:MAG: hypothetical protein A2Y09_06875 [Planctomycetes bacterium GWA2_39_15]